MSLSSAFKPPPLGYGSPPTRNSPFRRPESPVSPSPLRYTTPEGSPTKGGLASAGSASKLGRLVASTSSQDSWPPRGSATPVRRDAMATSSPTRGEISERLGNGNALSQLEPSQVRTLRDGFQILDRDCDGIVNREDVADMLNQLGLPSTPTDVSAFFPPSAPQTMPLAAFLSALAETLSALSPGTELMSAFSAFDNDDSGQIDLAELRDALMNTAPEPGQRLLTAAEVDKVMSGFTGRRAFNRNMNAQLGAKKGEVFKYQAFLNSLMGPGGVEANSRDASEA